MKFFWWVLLFISCSSIGQSNDSIILSVNIKTKDQPFDGHLILMESDTLVKGFRIENDSTEDFVVFMNFLFQQNRTYLLICENEGRSVLEDTISVSDITASMKIEKEVILRGVCAPPPELIFEPNVVKLSIEHEKGLTSICKLLNDNPNITVKFLSYYSRKDDIKSVKLRHQKILEFMKPKIDFADRIEFKNVLPTDAVASNQTKVEFMVSSYDYKKN